MQYYVSAKGPRNGYGTKEMPFRKISQAAELAKAGDEVIVLPGVYREWVNPKNGGTAEAPIVYRSAEPLGAVITGAEQVKNWELYEGNVWKAKIGNGLFGSYNPYTTLLHGDWYYSATPLHTGEIYLNGKSMFEVDSLASVLDDSRNPYAWFPEDSDYKWYTEQEDDHTVLYANFQGADPNKENVEINVRRNVFYPDVTGKGYITVQGFVLKQAATTWAPPTAYQEGLIGPHWSKGWVIEDCEVSDSKCCGVSLGKYLQTYNENKWESGRIKHGTQTERDAICQAQIDGWSKETIGSHIVRRCHIHHCEQTGIVGHLGGVFSIIEDNHIHHINTKQQLNGAEIGGIKMHAAIDTIIRRNHFHHCTRGLWLDWQAQGTRVSQNLFHDNMLPPHCALASTGSLAEDLFIEVSHGPTLVDNNLFLSAYAGRLATQGVAYVHNLIAGPFTKVGEGTDNGGVPNTPRYTPYHVPHRTEVVGFMTFLHGDMRFYNNIFVQQDLPENYKDKIEEFNLGLYDTAGTKPYDEYPTAEEYYPRFFKAGDVRGKEDRSKYYSAMPVYTGGNIFMAGAQPCKKELNFAVSDQAVSLELTEENGTWKFKTDLYEKLPQLTADFISTETLGMAFQPEQRFENPDGSEIFFNEDYLGEARAINPTPGPFEVKTGEAIVVW